MANLLADLPLQFLSPCQSRKTARWRRSLQRAHALGCGALRARQHNGCSRRRQCIWGALRTSHPLDRTSPTWGAAGQACGPATRFEARCFREPVGSSRNRPRATSVASW